MGPTASGKTPLAEALASELDAQLINADAFQIYRGLDIGTGKPQNRDQYALLDIVSPGRQFGLGEWLRLAQEHLEGLFEAGSNAILVGGTGLYIRGLMEEYKDIGPPPDPGLRLELMRRERTEGIEALRNELKRLAPDVATTVVMSNPLRVRRALEKALAGSRESVSLPPFSKVKLGIDPPADELRIRIAKRLDQMLEQGWLDEVRKLLDEGVSADSPGMKGIGYRTIVRHIEGELSLEAAKQEILTQTVQYAKRQRTWLRSEPGLIRLDWTDDLAPMLKQAVEIVRAAA